MKNKIYVLTLLIILLLIPSISFAESYLNYSGVYNVQKFNKIDIDGNFRVKISQNKSTKVEAIGRKDIVPNVLVNVISGTLFIRMTSDTRLPEGKPIEIKISSPEISKLSIADMSDVYVTNIDSVDFEIKLSNNSKATLSGKTKKFSLYASGKSKLNTDYFKVLDKAPILINLSGSVDIKLDNVVSNYLKADIKNLSILTISGDVKDFNLVSTGSALLNANNLKADNIFLNMEDCTESNVYAYSKLTAYLTGASTLNYLGNPLLIKHISKNSKLNHIKNVSK